MGNLKNNIEILKKSTKPLKYIDALSFSFIKSLYNSRKFTLMKALVRAIGSNLSKVYTQVEMNFW